MAHSNRPDTPGLTPWDVMTTVQLPHTLKQPQEDKELVLCSATTLYIVSGTLHPPPESCARITLMLTKSLVLCPQTPPTPKFLHQQSHWLTKPGKTFFNLITSHVHQLVLVLWSKPVPAPYSFPGWPLLKSSIVFSFLMRTLFLF